MHQLLSVLKSVYNVLMFDRLFSFFLVYHLTSCHKFAIPFLFHFTSCMIFIINLFDRSDLSIHRHVKLCQPAYFASKDSEFMICIALFKTNPHLKLPNPSSIKDRINLYPPFFVLDHIT